ncbi:MAG: helix-hairpin-helix domain-containing protein [Candidatus Omnitrophota bacterium]
MLNFTRQERQVLLFLISIALIGSGARFLEKKYSKVQVMVNNYQDIWKIDLNNSSSTALISVPGIGPVLSGRIIEYRNNHGGFKEVEELKNIKGISGYKYEKIRDYLTLDKQ